MSNRYFIMRHGQSEANVAGIIISAPDSGVAEYGLSEEGSRQVRLSASLVDGDVFSRVICSDFKRAQQTAQLVHEILEIVSPLETSSALRERFFGSLEGGSDSRYPDVWRYDVDDERHSNFGVESVGEVVNRTTQLIQLLEQRFNNESILLVSHGDTLQILQTLFEGVSPSSHRSLPPLAVAEIRRLGSWPQV
ncbi:MAG: histidine phosphatase family protein [Pseudomonadales bacterium]